MAPFAAGGLGSREGAPLSLNDRIKSAVVALDRRAEPWAAKSKLRGWAYEFLLFGLKQAWACLFGGLMLALLLGTRLFWPDDASLARYDFMVIAALGIQGGLIAFRLERWNEALVILIFHLVGTAMELFKTAHGSWSYPEPSVLRIGDVPLFSGFMYGCVGSYMARAIRLFDIRFERYPPHWTTWLLAIGAYVNFFTHHYVWDFRWLLYAWSVLIFGLAWFQFTPRLKARRMPMLLGFALVALFIWFAENLGTFASAWIYPNQRDGWEFVPPAKLGSWYLLMMLSYVLVMVVHPPRKALAPGEVRTVTPGLDEPP